MNDPSFAHQEYEKFANPCWRPDWIAFLFGIRKQKGTTRKRQLVWTTAGPSWSHTLGQVPGRIPTSQTCASQAYKLVQSEEQIKFQSLVKEMCWNKTQQRRNGKCFSQNTSLTRSKPHPVGIKASKHTMMSCAVIWGSAIKVIRMDTNVTKMRNLIRRKTSWKLALNLRLPTDTVWWTIDKRSKYRNQ